MFVGGGAGEAVGVQAAAEAMEFAFERGGIEGEGTWEAESCVVVDTGGGLNFAAVGAEKW